MSDSGRPEIIIEGGEMHGNVQATIDAVARNGNVWNHGGRLCEVHKVLNTSKAESAVDRAGSAHVIVPVGKHRFAEIATREVEFLKYDARREKKDPYKRTDCPLALAAACLDRGYFPEFRSLHAVSESPTLSLDGRLLGPGYDAETGILVISEPKGWRPPSTRPSRDDALKSVKIIREVFSEFPFVDDADESAAIALPITAAVRRSLNAAPMFGISSSTPGTGKTHLAEVCGVIANGHRPAVVSVGKDPAEWEKRMTGIYAAGDPFLLADNITRPYGDGDQECQVLTQPQIRVRLLSSSTMYTFTTAVTFVATGNNLALVGDMRRRSVLIRLEAGMERPELRRFKRDLLGYAAKHRAELLRAALTIPMAYHAAGCPDVDGLHPYAGFGQWDAMVRRPLAWLGLPDPLLSATRLREDDPDLESSRTLLESIRRMFPYPNREGWSRAVTVSEIIRSARESDGNGSLAHRELHDAVEVVCSEKISSRRLGNWLRRHRDRIVDGLQLVRGEDDSHAKVATWQVRPAG